MKREEHDPLVLVVDDDPDYRKELLPTMLRDLGCRVVAADQVSEGMRIVREHDSQPIALGIIDMHMPIGPEAFAIYDGGIHFLMELREYSAKTFPCIVFTAYPSPENRLQAEQAGAIAYICKWNDVNRPTSDSGPDALRNTVLRLLGRRVNVASG